MGIQPGGDFPSTILSSIFSFFFYFGYYIQCLCKMEHLVGSSPWGEGQLKLVITKTENKNTRSWFAKYFSFNLCYYFPTIFFIFYKTLWKFACTKFVHFKFLRLQCLSQKISKTVYCSIFFRTIIIWKH